MLDRRAVFAAFVLARLLPAADAVVFAGDAATWRVVGIHDGDTLSAIDERKVQHKIRLQGIDAPELGQAFGTKSRDRLAALTKGKSVEVESHGEDRFGRTLARVTVGGRDVNREMVAAGMAWHYTRYSDDKALAAAQRKAKASQRGLWADAHPVPPWEWRATERDRKPQPAGR